MNLSNIAILCIKGSNYCCIISLFSKNAAINLMQNADFTKKKWIIIKHKNGYKIQKWLKRFQRLEISKFKKTNCPTLVPLINADI